VYEFIERHLGLSPHGGDGSIEIMVLVLLVSLGTLIGLFLSIARAPRNNGSSRRTE